MKLEIVEYVLNLSSNLLLRLLGAKTVPRNPVPLAGDMLYNRVCYKRGLIREAEK